MNYIPNPIRMTDFVDNAHFQLSNVEGLMSVKDYQAALIKAQCLVEALQETVQHETAINLDSKTTINAIKLAKTASTETCDKIGHNWKYRGERTDGRFECEHCGMTR